MLLSCQVQGLETKYCSIWVFSYNLVAMICGMPYFLPLGQCQKWVVWARASRQGVRHTLGFTNPAELVAPTYQPKAEDGKALLHHFWVNLVRTQGAVLSCYWVSCLHPVVNVNKQFLVSLCASH